MCGATSEQKNTYADQSNLFKTMTSQAQQIFGNTSKVFQDIVGAFTPILKAGPDQEGFSKAVKSGLQSQAITRTGTAYQHAKEAVGNAISAVGGGNVYLPSGADIGANVQIANEAAGKTADELTNIDLASKEAGRQNFMGAAGVLSNAPNMFSASTNANNAAVGAGNATADTANQIAAANNSWVNAAFGALGGIAQTAVGKAMPTISTGKTPVKTN